MLPPTGISPDACVLINVTALTTMAAPFIFPNKKAAERYLQNILDMINTQGYYKYGDTQLDPRQAKFQIMPLSPLIEEI